MKECLRPSLLTHILITWLCLAAAKVTAATDEAATTPAPAATAPDTGWSERVKNFLMRDYMLGDWNGWRTNLSQRGIDFEFFYAGGVPSNVSGGIKQGSVYEGIFLMTMDLHSDKLLDYEGGQFHVGSLWVHNGRSFSPNFIGDLNVVSLLDFKDTFRLWELWYQQQFFNGRFTVKLGQMAIDRDFILPELSGTIGSFSFLNQTFFYPTLAFDIYDIAGFPRGSHALASTPYGTPGALVRWDPTPAFYAQAAVYDGNPDRSYSGTRINLNEDEGALAYFELGYRLNPGKNPAGMPGVYKVGAYYHTDDFIDVSAGTENFINEAVGLPGTDPRTHSGNYGVYLLAEQMLFREQAPDDPARQGLVGFFRTAAAPPDRNLAEFEIDGGLVYTGLIPTRDYDTIGLGASYLRISDDIRKSVSRANNAFGLGLALPDSESVIEISYKAQLTAWWTVQPSFQWVIHPGGRASADIPDALAVLVMTTLRL
ncbi:MAG: carbohydrate porin [Verrucomicrobiota bacterium]